LVRNQLMRYNLLSIILVILLMSCDQQEDSSIPIQIPELENMAIAVTPDQCRSFVFTNKESAFFYGETGRLHQDGHQGLHVMAQQYLYDYLISSDDRRLNRNEAVSIKVYPDHISRIYQGDIAENLYLLDNINCLIIEFNSPNLHSYDFTPLFPNSFDINVLKSSWNRNQDLFILGPNKSENSETNDQRLKYLGIRFDCSTQYNLPVENLPADLISAYQIGQFRSVKDNYRIIIVVGNDAKEIEQLTDHVRKNAVQLLDAKKKRLIKLLGDCYFETNLPDLNKAFRWAIISMDQLIMHQPGAGKQVTGIFAGLPWFNNYWGRDTFISLPGAVLVSGNFKEAKEILLSFAQFQNHNPADPSYGRIPNQVTTDNIIYNTADGTPWFVRELWEYYQYTGDRETLEKLYAVVKKAIIGTLKYHTDKYYFLTHGDAETWMDAKGTEGPWSPRGNRAVEIQALWYQQLIASSNIAKLLDRNKDVEKWLKIANTVKQNFHKKFWDDQRLSLFDHLNTNDNPDRKIRPNQIFSITIPEVQLIIPEYEFMVLKEIITKLSYSYGVASLWQHDPDFHPFHILPRYYPKDEAYHNGIVWGWLTGPVISSLTKYGYQNLAYELLTSESFQILNWGAVGTLSELLDAIPLPGNEIPQPSGTVSQAWSLAEYLRNIYQDLIGILPNVPEKTIVIAPHLPDEISLLTCCVPIPNSNLHLSMQQSETKFNIILNYIEGDQTWNIEVQYLFSPTEKVIFAFPIHSMETKNVQIDFEAATTVSIDGRQIGYRLETIPIRKELLTYFSFAVPQLDKNLNYLKPPPYPLLFGQQVKSWNKDATVLIDIDAPKFDDKGPNKEYVYPTGSYFQDGILDLTKFQLFADKDNYYFRLNFRNLVQPGWHPEYGFQLTFVAIAIAQKKEQTGAKFISRNANLQLPPSMSYHRIIFIGGGLQLEDEQGNILAVYRPEDFRYPLGDVQEKQISFAIPKSYLGKYEKEWRFAIVVGAQDDHGGGGIGEFRNVGKVASQWQGGGGAKEKGNCNVYDLFMVK